MINRDKRINRRFARLETYQPDFDTVSMIVDPDNRLIHVNKAAKDGANLIVLTVRPLRRNW